MLSLKKFSFIQFFKTYWLALVIAAICGTLQFLGLDMPLRYDRNLVNDGEFWRFLSANIVHLNWSHYWMNMGALGLLWLMFVQRFSTVEWLGVFLISSLIVSTGLQFLNPELFWYVGISGTLHGVISAGVWRELRYDKVFAIAVGGLTLAKLIYEQVVGPMPGSEESAGGPVIVDSHLYGAIGGLISAALLDLIRKLKK